MTDPVDEGDEMKLKRPVQQWIIGIAGVAPIRWINTAQPAFQVMQQPQGIIGMQAFVMVQRFISKPPEAQYRS
jgi:hypothetical protein